MPDVPTFHTPRLILREFVEADTKAYLKYFNDYEVIRHLGAGIPWPYPEDGVQEYFLSAIAPYQGKDKWVWVISLLENQKEVIGCIELLRKPSPTNRGFWLGKPFWGNGYMTEAVEPVTSYAFDQLGFEKLIFGNAVGNNRSARVKEKSGARLVRREKASYVDPTLTERDIYELSKNEWQRLVK